MERGRRLIVPQSAELWLPGARDARERQELTELELVEVSLVSLLMKPLARVQAVAF